MNDYIVSFVDLAIESISTEDFINILIKSNTKVIGISTYFESWSAIKSLVKLIKSYNNEIKVVGGGVCANFCNFEMIEELGFDYISLGEGENSFLDICNSLLRNGNLDNCTGISYRNQNREIVTKEPVRITELDNLPFPDRSVLNIEKYVYPFTISTARGCPGRCVFCSSYSFWGKKVYFRTVENIIDEIKYMEVEFKAKEFFIVDDTFTMIPKRTKQFCNMILQLEMSFIWGCESRADIIDKELLQIMYQAGCRKIQFGLESANNKILQSLNKEITFEQVENATKLASEIGFDINISVIIGHAEDTKETIEYTLDKSRQLKEKYNANMLFSINTPYPGTDLHKNVNEYGIEILTNNYDFYSTDNAIINTRHLTADDLRYYYNNILGLYKSV